MSTTYVFNKPKRKSRKKMIDGEALLRVLEQHEQRYLDKIETHVRGKYYVAAACYDSMVTGIVVAQNIVKNFLKG